MKAMESKVMRAMRLTTPANGTPRFEVAEVSQPKPAAGDVLVRVHAAGVTPTELGWEPTIQKKDGAPRPSASPPHEFSGVIAEVGSDVRDFQPGQEIYGMNDWYVDGGLAEFCVTQPSSLSKRAKLA